MGSGMRHGRFLFNEDLRHYQGSSLLLQRKTMNIAIVGLGLMGRAMAERLAEFGFTVHGYNRSPVPEHWPQRTPLATTEALNTPRAAIRVADNLAQAVESAHLVWVMLADFAVCKAVLLAPEHQGLWRNRLVINGSTISPDQSRALAQSIHAQGGRYLEAPVLGSTPQAQTGTLQILLGGASADILQADTLLGALGTPTHFGAVGQGAAVKLAMNQLIGSLTAAFSMSLGLVQAEGVDVGQFMETLRASALYAPTFDKKLQKMLERDFATANFSLKHLLKDLRLFTTAAEAHQIHTEMVHALTDRLEHACNQGASDADYSALFADIVPPASA
jgi:3-hydroxyisobutyrate dehydrogenase-like beta-hydroxyacid dehydrogenase